MAYEKRDGTGGLFRKDKKGHDNWPDYEGDMMVGGQEFWLSGFVKKRKDGTNWVSLSAKPKEAKPQSQHGVQTTTRQAAANPTPAAEFDDPLDF